MPRKKKKFIDKKNAVTFHLVHRSQKDPLQDSEEASKHVLALVKTDLEKRKEEQRKYGVFFDDEYDYRQHLKDVNEAFEIEEVDHFQIKVQAASEKPRLQLPSSVFASDVEKGIGLLNQAVAIRGPRPDFDPDIVAALDDDFDFEDPENQLPDDFISKANITGSKDEQALGHWDMSDDDVASDEAEMYGSDMDTGSDPGFYGDKRFMEEETKSHFTNYSMSSSVIRRSEGLTLLDDRFEKLYEEYEDTEIGALDHEEIDGCVQQGSQVLDQVLQEFQAQQKRRKFKELIDENKTGEDICRDYDEDSEDDPVDVVVEEAREKWDCESILSTYSTLYHHPTLIEEPKMEKIKFSKKLGIPQDVLNQPGLTRKQLEKEMRDSLKADRTSTYRPRGETADERKSRKQSVKDERKNRRSEKKINQNAFKVEGARIQKEQLNLKNNLQVLKIV